MYKDGSTLKVMRFEEAGELRWLSNNGGDEDFVVVEPRDVEDWRDNGAEIVAERLAICDYSEYVADVDGVSSRVFITCHA